MDYLKLAKKYLTTAAPLSLIYFVTKTCNCSCAHCFYWESLNKARPNELTLDELEKIAVHLGQLLYVRFSGGEPFIRRDLFDISKVFVQKCQPLYLGIPTNGYFTDRVVEYAEKAMKLNAYVEIGISIDDIDDFHNQIRVSPGLFDKAMETFRELKKIKKRSSNIGIGFIATAMRSNQPRLKELFQRLKEMDPDAIACNIVRDGPKVEAEKNIDKKLTAEFAYLCDEYNEKSFSRRDSFFQKMRQAKTKEGHLIRDRTIATEEFQIPCVAANKMVVMYSEGEIAPCETLEDRIGNIRDYDYDMHKLLMTDQAKVLRKKIVGEKCFCSHECFTSASITFNSQQLAKVIFKTLISR